MEDYLVQIPHRNVANIGLLKEEKKFHNTLSRKPIFGGIRSYWEAFLKLQFY